MNDWENQKVTGIKRIKPHVLELDNSGCFKCLNGKWDFGYYSNPAFVPENFYTASFNSKKFGGKVCFFWPVDIQNTMINGTIDDVRNYAKKLIDVYGSPAAVGHSREKIDVMSQVFVEYGSKFYSNK